jgi:hypothetical protein
MTILDWIKRRTKSSYADDEAVDEFTRVAKDQELPFDYEQGERLAKLMDDPGNLEEIAKLLGQNKF